MKPLSIGDFFRVVVFGQKEPSDEKHGHEQAVFDPQALAPLRAIVHERREALALLQALHAHHVEGVAEVVGESVGHAALHAHRVAIARHDLVVAVRVRVAQSRCEA